MICTNHTYSSIRPRFCVGLDLGKQTDFSALAALRFNWPSWGRAGLRGCPR